MQLRHNKKWLPNSFFKIQYTRAILWTQVFIRDVRKPEMHECFMPNLALLLEDKWTVCIGISRETGCFTILIPRYQCAVGTTLSP